MDLEELNKQLSHLNNDYQLFHQQFKTTSQHSQNSQDSSINSSQGDFDNSSNNSNNNSYNSNNNSYNSNNSNNSDRDNFDIQNMNQKNGKDYEARNDINERMNNFHRFDNDFMLRNQYQGESLSHTNQNSQNNNYQTYNTKEEDLRENMNNRMDNFIFDNPGNKLPSLVEIHENNLQSNDNIGFNYKPKVQVKSKNIYKNDANSRLENYSPLARSSHFPVKKNIDVQTNFYQRPVNKISKKDMMNDRLSNLPTLSKTITMGNNKSDKNIDASYDNRNITNTVESEKHNLNMIQNARQNEINNRVGLSKPGMPNFNDVNQGCSNVVFNEYPMFSN